MLFIQIARFKFGAHLQQDLLLCGKCFTLVSAEI